MADSTFNGWSSWATWNVALWIQNDEGLYRYVRSLAHRGVRWPQVARDLTTTFGNSCTPDGAPWVKADETELNNLLSEL